MYDSSIVFNFFWFDSRACICTISQMLVLPEITVPQEYGLDRHQQESSLEYKIATAIM